MKYAHKFSFSFSHEKLKEELLQVQQQWTNHFNTGFYNGEWSGIPLRSPLGSNHPLVAGQSENGTVYKDESLLDGIPYTRSVIEYFKTEKLSVRYLRLTPGSEIKPHRDYDMVFWDGFVRLHIPVITNSFVQFNVGGYSLPMQPGDCWFADFSRPHRVINQGTTDRIHLVIDCRVNTWITDLFLNEGILADEEQKPDPLDQYANESRQQLILQLLTLNTETASGMAAQIAGKYGIPLPGK